MSEPKELEQKDGKSESQIRYLQRLHKLRQHHIECENRHMHWLTKSAHDEKERTLHLQTWLQTVPKENQRFCEDSSVGVPELTRTDSVLLDRMHVGFEDCILKCSEEEVVPDTTDSDGEPQPKTTKERTLTRLKKKKKRVIRAKTSTHKTLDTSELDQQKCKNLTSSGGEDKYVPDKRDVTDTDSEPQPKTTKERTLTRPKRVIRAKTSTHKTLDTSELDQQKCENLTSSGGEDEYVPDKRDVTDTDSEPQPKTTKERTRTGPKRNKKRVIRAKTSTHKTLDTSELDQQKCENLTSSGGEDEYVPDKRDVTDTDEKIIEDSDATGSENEDCLLSQDSGASSNSSENTQKRPKIVSENGTDQSGGSMGCTSTQDPEVSSKSPESSQMISTDASQIEKGQASKGQKRKWTAEEVEAVEKTLLNSILTGRVPGKALCLECIEASPEALSGRSWKAIKFYIKNRIDSAKRESFKRK
ncbi:uncharacterized protein LOC129457141 [Periophthalmus magnuspinnatus]|uniref:uncharacterized protein LOC129457141 n=1 Tax=Periophthalmus magnuspinnatus TaxID=409849 RepID=UPI002436ACBD|nr:uncharacterized protein LOC129457141 [Periophthalmus magnuspinnatus]